MAAFASSSSATEARIADTSAGQPDCMPHMKELRVLDFFSGIGGCHAALKRLGLNPSYLQAYDINQQANKVYYATFGHKPSTRSIPALTAAEVERHNATLWVMTPPCQPYTRIGLKRDDEDKRAAAFLHLCQLMVSLKTLPRAIFVENVKGFEGSNCHRKWLEVIGSRGYHIQEYLLDPTQLGIPNTRLRYYCLAWLAAGPLGDGKQPNQPTGRCISQALPACATLRGEANCLRPLRQFLNLGLVSGPEVESLLVPQHILSKAGEFRFDVATAASTLTTTIAKGYGKHLRGSGPVLLLRKSVDGNGKVLYLVAEGNIREYGNTEKGLGINCTAPPAKKAADSTTKGNMRQLNTVADAVAAYQARSFRQVHQDETVRYLATDEMLRLHGFPDGMVDMSMLTIRQQRALIGNSVSVDVVSVLLQHLLQQVAFARR